MRWLSLLLLAPLYAFAVTDYGTLPTIQAAETPLNTYRFPPHCIDANLDGHCEGYPVSSWTQSVSIGSLDPACNAGDDGTASPAIHPSFSMSGGPAGLSINSTTGVITGTPTTPGEGTATITCANDLGSRTDLLVWTITPHSGGTGTAATGYFVDCQNGNDSNPGTAAAPWKTITKVNNTTFAAGDDVWFRAGTTCAGSSAGLPLVVDWQGESAANPSIIGSYYIDSGNAFQSVPSNDSNTVRPSAFVYPNGRSILQGNYSDACRIAFDYQGEVTGHADTTRCSWNGNATYFTTNPSYPAVPTSRDTGLIQIKGPSGIGPKWIVVQDLVVQDSSGRGIVFDSNPHIWCLNNNSACVAESIVQRNLVTHNAASGITSSNVSRIVIRKNEVSLDNLQCPDGQPGVGPHLRCGAGITMTGTYPAQQLVEQNDVHDSWGENLGFYQTGFVLARGNHLGNGSNAPINFAGGSNLIAEQNILVAGSIALDTKALAYPTYYRGGGDDGAYNGISYENSASTTVQEFGIGAIPGDKTLWRNNLSGNWRACLSTYTLTSTASTTQFDLRAYGNTCRLAAGDNGVGALSASLQNAGFVKQIIVQNTLFDTPDGASAGSVSGSGVSKYTFATNQWKTTPTDSNLNPSGKGNLVSSTTGLPSATPSSYDWSSFPAYTDFVPTSGAGANLGTDLSATLPQLEDANWDWVFLQMLWVPTCNSSGLPSRTAWNKENALNYCLEARDSSPDIGSF